MHFVSKTCAGVHCACGQPATHKIGEESYPDHPGAHPDPLVNAAELAVIRSLPPELGFTAGLTAYVCCEHFLQLMGPSAPCPVSDVVASKRDRVAELSDELAEVRADSADLIKRRDELLALVVKLSQTVPLESEVGEALEQRGVLLAEIGTLRSEIGELQEKLRIAEAVRDDARAVSARDLEARRSAEMKFETARGSAMHAYRQLEELGRSVMAPVAKMSRDDKIAAILAVLRGDHDDASAMVEAIRKIVIGPGIHTDCIRMPGGTGPCACLDGCGACDSCGRWLCIDDDHVFVGDSCRECGEPVPVSVSPDLPAWKRPGASSTEIRDAIIAEVGMDGRARTPEMQAAYDAALVREGWDPQDQAVHPPEMAQLRARFQLDQMQHDAAEKQRLLQTGQLVVTVPASPERIAGWKKGVLESIDKLAAYQANVGGLTYDKALELLNTLYQHPPAGETHINSALAAQLGLTEEKS